MPKTMSPKPNNDGRSSPTKVPAPKSATCTSGAAWKTLAMPEMCPKAAAEDRQTIRERLADRLASSP